jgi:alanine racemase
VRAFLVERDVDADLYPEAGFVRVGHSIRALHALAAHFRSSFEGTVVGVTGSAGKTTVKEWIALSAPAQMSVFRSPRSYNSQLGVPLSVFMMRGEDVAVIEAGISRPREMEHLARIIMPRIGIFTGIGPEHGENFETQMEKIAEKAKLFAGSEYVIYDGSPEIRAVLERGAPGAELIDASPYRAQVPFADEMSRSNGALAIAFHALMGHPSELTAERLSRIELSPMRFGLSEGIMGSLVITDHDNNDINSLPIALDYAKGVASGRPVAVVLSDIRFGSLPENELYGRTAQALLTAGVEKFVGVGESISRHRGEFAGLAAEFYPTAAEFLSRLRQDMFAGRAVLVRGDGSPDWRRIVHHLERRAHTTVLEIDLDAMAHNLAYYRALSGQGVKIMAMVKAAGYGNGGFEVANMLQKQGVDYLAVAFADEGVRLREQGISMPIVVLNADADSFDLMVAGRLEPEIYNAASLRAFAAATRCGSEGNYPVHIKLDSGMHRLGFGEGDLAELIELLEREKGVVKVRSLFSHLAAADDPAHDDFTRGQIALFDRMSRTVADALGYMPLRHVANSAAMERFPQAHYDMCRLGIGLYGVWGEKLRPVSRLVTRIVQVRELRAGETVGYGRAGVLLRDSRLAVLPVGYADGLDRRLGSGRWSVLIAGRPAPTVGRISMDSCVVDITGIDAREGDGAIVFGGMGDGGVCEMARRLDTIPYEIMTSIPERVKRIFIKE